MREEPIGVILGSSFSAGFAAAVELVAETIPTPYGAVTLHRTATARPAYCLFRHGLPHRLLPQHIDFRANARALCEVGVGSLLVTSSVGVLDATVPLFEPLLVSDLLMLDNRLPDGSLCTMFDAHHPAPAHLVLNEGLFSSALGEQLRRLAVSVGQQLGPEVVFGYAPGPRTKSRSENAAWAVLGAQVNSMTLAPEVVLANELEIPCAGLVVGHKYSLPGPHALSSEDVAESLTRARVQLEELVRLFLQEGEAVPFANALFRFHG